MSKENKPPANPLFSTSNLNFAPNALFMPVQEQSSSSAILSAEDDPAEEASFIGQAPSFSQQQQQQNVATFTMFSQKADGFQDPFASLSAPAISTTSNPSQQPALFSSDQQEPQLVVPPKSPDLKTHSVTDSHSSSPVPTLGSTPSLHGQPPMFDNRATPANPYARSATSGHKPRPMFPSNAQLYQSPLSQPAGYNTPPPAHSMPQAAPRPPSSSVTPPSFENLAASPAAPPPPSAASLYQHVSPHWFYCKKLSDNNLVWCPFSHLDSNSLETAFHHSKSQGLAVEKVISTDGGRYDVSVNKRERTSVYWDEEISTVRRATWFCKSDSENRYSPYAEAVADRLEAEYHNVVTKGLWHNRIELENGEVVVVHSPQLIVHFQPVASKDEFGSVFETQMHSKVVKRGISGTEFEKEIPESESGTPDHVVFLCHGIGPVCDLRSRSVVECVDDFRTIHLSLLQTHFKKGLEAQKAHRIEFLPIHWHRALHGDATGVDRNVRKLTLPSISRLRHFTNETLLDILFYSSPVYCQTIADTIGNEINALYKLFLSRNPTFQGEVSLAGHSLGSLILFDLLCHQSTESAPEAADQQLQPDSGKLDVSTNGVPPDNASTDHSVSSDQASNGIKASSSSHSLSSVPEESLDEFLQRLGMERFLSKFEEEQIDMDALLLCTESDLKDIGLPMGPRKKLQGHLKKQREMEARKREMEEQKQKEEELKQQQEAAALALAESKISAPQMDHMDSMGSFFSAATNVHVDFQQFDVGTGQPVVNYPQLSFQPKYLFALGSPIGVFLTVRGASELGEDFALPTCPGFLNIFHPFDPVAYRMEPLVNPDFQQKPVLVPHYKGRKRMHLELKESLGRMGQELKQSIMRSVRLAVGSMQRFAQSHWSQTQKNTEAEVEEEVKNMTEQILQDEQDKTIDNEDTASITSEVRHADLGRLNSGKRIDYVLQERPLESFNDYLFAFQSHLCYWNNEDTVLLVMKELYGMMGVLSDSQIEKQKALAPPPPPAAQYGSQAPPMTNISLN